MRVVHNDFMARLLVEDQMEDRIVPPFVGLVVYDGDLPMGAVIINDYTKHNAEMSAIGVGCWTPLVVRYIARYLFRKLNVCRVTARTSLHNDQALRALRAMGFTQEGILRDWYGDDGDCLVFGLTAREQRLIR